MSEKSWTKMSEEEWEEEKRKVAEIQEKHAKAEIQEKHAKGVKRRDD
jgi:hypothetical protein